MQRLTNYIQLSLCFKTPERGGGRYVTVRGSGLSAKKEMIFLCKCSVLGIGEKKAWSDSANTAICSLNNTSLPPSQVSVDVWAEPSMVSRGSKVSGDVWASLDSGATQVSEDLRVSVSPLGVLSSTPPPAGHLSLHRGGRGLARRERQHLCGQLIEYWAKWRNVIVNICLFK